MKPYYADDRVRLLHGDCLDVLPSLPDCSVDAVVTDPPYSLSFMGREWDSFRPAQFQAWCEKWAAECLRVLRPGGHLLAFGGTRTYHRLVCGVEDAGLEVRDSLHWIYGSGFLPFPKSHDVSKAIDKAAGAAREVVGPKTFADGTSARRTQRLGTGVFDDPESRETNLVITAPATEDAARWSGWGSALKPAHEPIVMARKPLTGTLAGNVLAHGTGAINVDGCRVAATPEDVAIQRARTGGVMHKDDGRSIYGAGKRLPAGNDAGRWPPNILLTHSADCNGDCAPGCPVAEMDAQSGNVKSAGIYAKGSRGVGPKAGAASIPIDGLTSATYADSGGASRFFPCFRYEAKAPARERPRLADGTAWPTVKPLSLMRWLVRLVTPPGGTVLDPFAGTGTTGEAAAAEGFRCLLIERDPVALELAVQRLGKPSQLALAPDATAHLFA